MRDRAELTKEEKNKERSVKKRKIKAKAHSKSIDMKEKRRQEGLQIAERFAVRDTKRTMEKLKKKGKGGEEKTARRTNGSTTVFKNLQKIVADDYKRKEEKKTQKETGKKAQNITVGNTRKYML
jgi:hypothetical protein